MSHDERCRFFTPLVLILFIAALLRFYGIWSQPLLSDEINAAVSAVNYMENGLFGPTMWYHPNLRNILLYGLGNAADFSPLSLRGTSLVLGTASVVLVALIVRDMCGRERAALIAAFLLAVEEVHITFSRQGIQEAWTTFFILAGVYAFVRYRCSTHPGMLLITGLLFGLGLSSKLHVLFPLAVCGIWGIVDAWHRRSVADVAVAVAMLGFLPLLVYLLTYLPWFGRGYDMAEWLDMQRAIMTKMTQHRGNPYDQTIDIRAWQWFVRPMGYANFTVFNRIPFLTVAQSNPLVWLAVLPAAGMTGWRLLTTWLRPVANRHGDLLVLAMFLASYLPLVVTSRPIWLLSALPVLPFAFMLIALTIDDQLERRPASAGPVALFLAAALLTSLLLYPMAIGRGKHVGYLSFITDRYRPAFERQSPR